MFLQNDVIDGDIIACCYNEQLVLWRMNRVLSIDKLTIERLVRRADLHLASFCAQLFYCSGHELLIAFNN